MRVALWYNNSDIRIHEVPMPEPGPREMLVKVLSCGICGSDVVEWYRLPRAPLVQGHEIGAEVVKTGDAVKGYKPGNRVCIAPKVPCLKCSYCSNGHYPVCSEVKDRLPGGFAEYILVPENLVEKGTYRLPAHVTYDQSTFIEPLACVVRSQNLAGLRDAQTVLVLGCGMSGLLQVKMAKSRNCRVVAVDVNKARLHLALKAGADAVLDAGEDVSGKLTARYGRKADVVLVCTGALAAIDQSWSCVDKGGAVVFFAVPGPGKQVTIPINEFWTREIRVLTSYYCGPSDMVTALELIASRTIQVDDMVTHRLPLNEVAHGFKLVMTGQESIKVIIRPND